MVGNDGECSDDNDDVDESSGGDGDDGWNDRTAVPIVDKRRRWREDFIILIFALIGSLLIRVDSFIFILTELSLLCVADCCGT